MSQECKIGWHYTLAVLVVVVGVLIWFNFNLESEKELKVSQKTLSKTDWDGNWSRKDPTGFYGAGIKIENVTSSSFSFDINAASGGNAGQIDGIAYWNGDVASFTSKDYPECKLSFNLKDSLLLLTQTDECYVYGGIGVSFEGDYTKGKNIIGEISLFKATICYTEDGEDVPIFKTDAEIKSFTNLVGDNYVKLFLNSFQLINGEHNADLNARVCSGGVRGLYTIREGIIVISSSDKIWAAIIDGDVVRYFTNVPDYVGRIPQVIENWRSRFNDKDVIFMNKK